MAYQTAAHHYGAPFLSRALSAIGHFFVAIGEANPRMKKVEALQRLSDAELAKKGLRREDIVRHVFQDIFYV